MIMRVAMKDDEYEMKLIFTPTVVYRYRRLIRSFIEVSRKNLQELRNECIYLFSGPELCQNFCLLKSGRKSLKPSMNDRMRHAVEDLSIETHDMCVLL